MLEKIGDKKYLKLSFPNEAFLDIIENLKQKRPKNPLTVAEIGIGIGATAIEAARLLNEEDSYYLFDYSNKVNQLKVEIEEQIKQGPKIITFGNSYFTSDSYVWPLFHCMKELKGDLFDVVLLDGAHDFTIDLAATALLIPLLREKGYIILDDISLSPYDIYTHNQAYEKAMKEKYAPQQRKEKQIEMVCFALLDQNDRFEKVQTKFIDCAVYRKR